MTAEEAVRQIEIALANYVLPLGEAEVEEVLVTWNPAAGARVNVVAEVSG